MTDQLTDPFAKLFESATKNPLAEPMQSAIETGLTTTCDATLKSLALAKDSAEAASKAAPLAADATVALTEKVFEQAVENTKTIFEAARAIVSAKSPAEAIKLQNDFAQTQIAKVGEQIKELFQLSAKVGEDQVASFKTSATRALGQFKA